MDSEFDGNSYLTEQFTQNQLIFREGPVQQWDDQPNVQRNRTQFVQNPFGQWNPHNVTSQIWNHHNTTSQIWNSHNSTAHILNPNGATSIRA